MKDSCYLSLAVSPCIEMHVNLYLLVDVQLAEDLSRIQKVLVVKDPRSRTTGQPGFLIPAAPTQKLLWNSYSGRNVLLSIECQQRQVENEREPVAVNQE
jgi:hypothetical protein